jgi:hypothetical protein
MAAPKHKGYYAQPQSSARPRAAAVFYHWAPRSDREAIELDGLRPPFQITWAPSLAWLTQSEWHHHPPGVWDLWEVWLSDDDSTEETNQGSQLRVDNVLPPDRLVWVGERMTTIPDPKQPLMGFGREPERPQLGRLLRGNHGGSAPTICD